MDLQLLGKKAVVTGGSKGIGLETARRLANEGADVMICARRPDALKEAAADITQSTGRRVETMELDVTNLAQIESLPTMIKAKLGHIDLLVNNAGTGTYKPFLEVTDDELQYGMEINFFAQFRICQRIIPMMMKRGSGHIVNVAGETGIMVTNPPFLSSCTGPAKAAEIRLSKILANEFAPHNIRVNCVVPGFVTTPERFAKWERELAKTTLSAAEADEARTQWSTNNAMRNTRWGTPEELANLIVFALSDINNFVNGAVLVADGAMDKS
jgi:NAD(P)-dependent dehydrogenase (short-subunit alcohol dehydrogenase family)